MYKIIYVAKLLNTKIHQRLSIEKNYQYYCLRTSS